MNKKISILILVLSASLSLISCGSQEKTDEGSKLSDDNRVNQIIEEKTQSKDKKERRSDAFVSGLEDIVDPYTEAINELNNNPSEENEREYEKVWRGLVGITGILDGMSRDFTPEVYIEINNKYIELDNLMREKRSGEEVEAKIEEIVALIK